MTQMVDRETSDTAAEPGDVLAFAGDETWIPDDPHRVRRRVIIGFLLLLGLVTAGFVLAMAGAALGDAPTGCGGG